MKTWRDIEEAALTDPVLYQLVTVVARGDLTREQALIHAVLGLATVRNDYRATILELVNTRVPRIIVVGQPDS